MGEVGVPCLTHLVLFSGGCRDVEQDWLLCINALMLRRAPCFLGTLGKERTPQLPKRVRSTWKYDPRNENKFSERGCRRLNSLFCVYLCL